MTTDPVLLVDWRDEGCRFWRACLSCPFPRCLHEEPAGPSPTFNALRNAAIRALHRRGWTALALSAAFGLSRRGIYHVLKGTPERAA